MAGPLQAQKVAKQRISGYIRSKIFCRAYISVLYSDRIIAVCRMVLLWRLRMPIVAGVQS